MNKRKRFTVGAVVILFAAAGLTLSKEAGGQTAPQRLALKDGESIELYAVYYVANLVYRVKYRTKDGPRVTSSAYLVSLFP